MLITNERKHEKTLQNFQQREESLQKREETIKTAEVRLAARESYLQKREKKLDRREETLEKREKSVKLAEEKLRAREDLPSNSAFIRSLAQDLEDQANDPKQIESLNNFNFNHIISQERFPTRETTKKIKNVKFTGPQSISWENRKYLSEMEIKEQIESCLQQKEKKMSNGLFDCISKWFKVSDEAKPFVQKHMCAMAEYVDIARRGNFMKTPLMYAAELDAVKAVVKLVERGAQMEAVDETGCTSLHVATMYGNASSCRVLLVNGAKVDPQDKYGETPLMYSCKDGHVEIVRLLLHLGADPKIKNSNGKTALQLARDNCANLIELHEQKRKINENC